MRMVDGCVGIGFSDRLEFAPLLPVGRPLPNGLLQVFRACHSQEPFPCGQNTDLFVQVKEGDDKFAVLHNLWRRALTPGPYLRCFS